MWHQLLTMYIGKLKSFVEHVSQRNNDRFLEVARNVSSLASQVHVSLLESTLHNLRDNVTDLERTFTRNLERIEGDFHEQVTELAFNVSSNGEHLQDLSSTQAEHEALISQLRMNISTLDENIGEQLHNVREEFTTMLTGVDLSVTQINTSHEMQLRNLSLTQR